MIECSYENKILHFRTTTKGEIERRLENIQILSTQEIFNMFIAKYFMWKINFSFYNKMLMEYEMSFYFQGKSTIAS